MPFLSKIIISTVLGDVILSHGVHRCETSLVIKCCYHPAWNNLTLSKYLGALKIIALPSLGIW